MKIKIFYVFDAHSDGVAEYFEPVYGSDAPEISGRILELFGQNVFGNNLLILDRLEILPKYRGKKVGLRVLRHIINRFSPGAAIVGLKAFPLQFESLRVSNLGAPWQKKMELDSLTTDEDSATYKLCQYYSKLGFVRLDNTSRMFLSTALLLPDLED